MICGLDYLVGTLATAYKGVITSLVVKDFCICREGGSALLRGAILSMPGGGYEASLIKEGVELARAPVARDGGFELRAGGAPVTEARDLQIDVLQEGRHIGTFLLKREKSGVFYTPAVELSREVNGVDFKLLTLPLREKPGLLGKAEDIIYDIFSAKKDWMKFSDELQGFATDLFWGARDVFYLAFGILARFSCLALENTGPEKAGKPARNFLDLIGLPLSREDSAGRLRAPAEQWLDALGGARAAEKSKKSKNLSGRAWQALKVFSLIDEKVPEADIRPAFLALLSSLRRAVAEAPVFSERTLDGLKGAIPPGSFGLIEKLGSRGRGRLLAMMEEAGENKKKDLAQKGELREALLEMAGLKDEIELFLDRGELTRSFFDMAGRYLSAVSAPAFTQALFELLNLKAPDMEGQPPDIEGQAPAPEGEGGNKDLVRGTLEFMRGLMAAGRTDLCAELLSRAAKQGRQGGLKNLMALNSDVASLILGQGGGQLEKSGKSGETLASVYRGLLQGILVPSPGVSGYSPDTWAERANPLHLEILSRFMDVLSISMPPIPDTVSDTGRAGGLEDVKAHLICNLHVSGVFIPDDRLFQRRVSGYLNSPAMRGDFLLNYMLLRELPVYFSEIGAASRIRDYTTQIDSWGNDPVLYFLRKQVHVNASNYNIRLAGGIMRAWVDNDADLLAALVPADVFRSFNKGMVEVYHRAITPFFEALGVVLPEKGGGKTKTKILFDRLLELPEESLGRELENIRSPRETRSKVFLLCRIYQEIVRKYSFSYSRPYSIPSARGAEKNKDLCQALGECLREMTALRETILSPVKTEPAEDLYFKRHIAFGIPSVLGTYREEKFDALGNFLRTGEKARVLMEAAVMEVSGAESQNQKKQRGRKGRRGEMPEWPGEQDIARWITALGQASAILELHGIANFQVRELLGIFSSNRLFISQALDMLRMWQKELKWEVESFGRALLAPLGRVLEDFPRDELPDYLANLDPGDVSFVDKAADIIVRDLMAGIPGFTETDRLLEAVAGRLAAIAGGRGDLEFNLQLPRETDDLFDLDGLADGGAVRLSPLLGGKAKNLVYLKNKGFDVPEGAVFSARHTEDYMAFTEGGEFRRLLEKAVRGIEEKTGKVFGGGKNPLFLSVRSGSYISMPGILASILYCGMNPETVRGLIGETGSPWFAWDSYRRFLEHYGMVALGVEAGVFEGIKASFAKGTGASPDKSGAPPGTPDDPPGNPDDPSDTPDEMDEGRTKGLVRAYMEAFSRKGLSVPEDVYEQLRGCVRGVYASWHGERSVQFARFTGMSRRWGTAVTLMRMIYGNQPGAGASVFFTRDPATMQRHAYGEIRELSTGDDLVYGARTNRPLSRKQKELFSGSAAGGAGTISLEEKDPGLFGMIEGLARRVEDALGGLPQEVETTYCTFFPSGQRKIYVLQARRMEFFDSGFIPRFQEICMMEPKVIGRGIGVHGGALSGVASFSFSPEAIRELGRKTGLPVIVLRHSASTSDVSLMADIGGMITAAGGATSHASVLAQKFGLTAIVGCKDLSFEASREGTPYARIGGFAVSEGTPMSMDGATGLIFSGTCLHTSGGRYR